MEAAVKRPPFLGTYVAVAVLAALGAYIYFVESKREDTAGKAKEKVFALDKTKVEGLALSAAGQEEVLGCVHPVLEPRADSHDEGDVRK